MFKHLRGPTCPSCSARAAGFPLFLFLLTLRNFTVSKLPVLLSHTPHLITDTCLSKKIERDRPRVRTFQAFEQFLYLVTLSVNPTLLISQILSDSFYNPDSEKKPGCVKSDKNRLSVNYKSVF